MSKDDKKLNEVIRVRKKQSGYVMLDKEFLENESLSWKAKGILAYLLSKPDNWKVIVRDIVNHSTDGKAAIYSGLNELKGCGYYEKKPVRNDKGAFLRWDSTVYECPAESLVNTVSSPLTDFSEMENPKMDNPDMENRERNNNDFNKDLSFNNIQSSQSEPDRRDRTESQIRNYEAIIKDNIKYSDFTVRRPEDMRLIDEFIAIIVEALMLESEYVRIERENVRRELVQHELIRLTYGDIEHVIEQFRSQTTRIKKKKQYILTMFYNSKKEFVSHYTNLVKHDMWNGGGC